MKIMNAFGISEANVAEIMQSSKFKENGMFKVDRPDVDDISHLFWRTRRLQQVGDPDPYRVVKGFKLLFSKIACR